MKKILLITIAFFLLIYIAYESYERYRINKLNSKVSTLEEALAQLDALKNDTTLSDYQDHIIISPDSSIFNKQEADLAYKNLIKTLTQKKIINIEKDTEQAIEIDSYDATDNCYKFRVVSLSKDTTLGTYILGWWEYFPKTKKVVNGITFQELN